MKYLRAPRDIFDFVYNVISNKKNKPYTSVFLVSLFRPYNISRSQYSSLNAKPSIAVRAELSQRHFIFRAYVGGCAQFIALGKLRTGENSQQSPGPPSTRLLFLVFLSGLCPRVRFSLRSSCAPLHDRKGSSACSEATRVPRKRRVATTRRFLPRSAKKRDDARCPGRELVSHPAIHISRRICRSI